MKVFFTFIIFLTVVSSVLSQDTLHRTVYFKYNRYDLADCAKKILEDIIQISNGNNVRTIQIEGHTDNIGSREYNMALSAKRVNNCIDFFEREKLTSPKLLSAMKGFDSPVASNENEAGRKLNRRVEITIILLRNKPLAEYTTYLQQFTEDRAPEIFNINADNPDTTVIRTIDGVVISIPPHSIVDKKGKPVTGNVKLIIKAYLTPADIILAGLNTVSNTELLQTGGMFNIRFIKEPDTLRINAGHPVEIKIPVAGEASSDMKVFTTHGGTDTAWQSTSRPFRYQQAYWDWPQLTGWRSYELAFQKFKYENWIVGKSYSDVYVNKWIEIFVFRDIYKNHTQKVSYTIIKSDTGRIKITVHAKLRAKGRRLLKRTYYDTSFTVDYIPGQYVANLTDVNWINCDRFIRDGRRVDFYVNCNKISGGSVFLYFKRLNAFYPGVLMGNGKYKFKGVPENEDIYVVGYGSSNGEYFFAKKRSQTSAQASIQLDYNKISKQELKKLLVFTDP